MCATCAEMVERCVYCREPRRVQPDGFVARMYLALYYSSLISYMLVNTEVDPDPFRDYWEFPSSDSESETSAGGVVHS